MEPTLSLIPAIAAGVAFLFGFVMMASGLMIPGGGMPGMARPGIPGFARYPRPLYALLGTSVIWATVAFVIAALAVGDGFQWLVLVIGIALGLGVNTLSGGPRRF